jgi:hypothetical protein
MKYALQGNRMNSKKIYMALILILCCNALVFSGEEKQMSVQGNPLTYLTDMALC